MTTEMDKQNRRAARILRQFGRYVDEAMRAEQIGPRNFGANLDAAANGEPTIARTKPRTYARIKRGVAWRLMAKGRKP